MRTADNLTAAPTESSLDSKDRSTWRDKVLLFLALGIANAANYLFHVVISRMLGPASYGALTALLASFLVLAVPASAVQLTVAKLVAQSKGFPNSIVRRATMEFLLGGVALSLVLLAVSAPLRGFLHLPNIASAAMLAAYALPLLIGAVLQGALQGASKFGRLALVIFVSTLARLAFGIIAVKAGFGVAGAAAASAVSQLLLVVVGWIALVPVRRAGSTSTDRAASIVRPTMWSAAALTGFWVLVGVDTFMSRHYLSAAGSGLYGAAATLSRSVLFVPGAIAMMALPRFAALRNEPVALRKSVLGYLMTALFLSGLAALALLLLPGLGIKILFGSSYMRAASLVRPLAIMMVMLSGGTIFLYYHVAIKARATFVFWGAAVAEIAAIAAFHANAMAIALIATIASAVVILLQVTTLPRPKVSMPMDAELLRPEAELDLTLVTPSYNGALFVKDALEQMKQTLRNIGVRYEIIVVSDGSTDATPEIVRSLESDDLFLVDYEQRQGKGEALRRGMMRARGEYVAFIDSDGDLHPKELEHFLTIMKTYHPDIVIGSKRHPLSQVSYPTSRRLMSWVYQALVRILFGLNVRDTQTGIKMVRRDVLAKVLPRMVEKRFAFDLELLVVAKETGYSKIFEAPVSIDYKFQSTVALRDSFNILKDTSAIWYRRYILKLNSADSVAAPHSGT